MKVLSKLHPAEGIWMTEVEKPEVGPNDLLRQGATLCEGVEDVLRAFEGLRTLREPPADRYDPDPGDVDAATLERIAALLSPTPIPRDELARATGLPIGVVVGALLELSLTGRATLLPGGLASD